MLFRIRLKGRGSGADCDSVCSGLSRVLVTQQDLLTQPDVDYQQHTYDYNNIICFGTRFPFRNTPWVASGSKVVSSASEYIQGHEARKFNDNSLY